MCGCEGWIEVQGRRADRGRKAGWLAERSSYEDCYRTGLAAEHGLRRQSRPLSMLIRYLGMR